jgi:hypothetical protein
MGADMADINNDGKADVFCYWYASEQDERLKNWTLKHPQLNNGNGQFNELLIMQVYQNRLELGCVALWYGQWWLQGYLCL